MKFTRTVGQFSEHTRTQQARENEKDGIKLRENYNTATPNINLLFLNFEKVISNTPGLCFDNSHTTDVPTLKLSAKDQ